MSSLIFTIEARKYFRIFNITAKKKGSYFLSLIPFVICQAAILEKEIRGGKKMSLYIKFVLYKSLPNPLFFLNYNIQCMGSGVSVRNVFNHK